MSRTARRVLALAPALLLVLLAALDAPAGEGEGAMQLRLVEHPVRGLKIETMESAPAQFALLVAVDLPDPGTNAVIAGVTGPDEAGVIRVAIDATRSEGIHPQVITPTTLRAGVGSLETGRYLVDVRWRMDGGEAVRAAAFVVEAL